MHSAALARNESFIELRKEEERRAQRCKHMKRDSWRVYCRIRWGQRKRQFILLNAMLKRLIAETADPAALQSARRFHPFARENIYRAAVISQRARQLIDVFPTLGLAIYCPPEESEYWEKARDGGLRVVIPKVGDHLFINPDLPDRDQQRGCANRSSMRPTTAYSLG
jgi:hypothetical protein